MVYEKLVNKDILSESGSFFVDFLLSSIEFEFEVFYGDLNSKSLSSESFSVESKYLDDKGKLSESKSLLVDSDLSSLEFGLFLGDVNKDNLRY